MFKRSLYLIIALVVFTLRTNVMFASNYADQGNDYAEEAHQSEISYFYMGDTLYRQTQDGRVFCHLTGVEYRIIQPVDTDYADQYNAGYYAQPTYYQQQNYPYYANNIGDSLAPVPLNPSAATYHYAPGDAYAAQIYAAQSSHQGQIVYTQPQAPVAYYTTPSLIDLAANRRGTREDALAYQFQEGIAHKYYESSAVILLTDSGYTPLHLAIHNNLLNLASSFFKTLSPIDKCRVLTIKDATGNTILHLVLKKLKPVIEQDNYAGIRSRWRKHLLAFAAQITECADPASYDITDNDNKPRAEKTYYSARDFYMTFLAPYLRGTTINSRINQPTAHRSYCKAAQAGMNNKVVTNKKY